MAAIERRVYEVMQKGVYRDAKRRPYILCKPCLETGLKIARRLDKKDKTTGKLPKCNKCTKREKGGSE